MRQKIYFYTDCVYIVTVIPVHTGTTQYLSVLIPMHTGTTQYLTVLVQTIRFKAGVKINRVAVSLCNVHE